MSKGGAGLNFFSHFAHAAMTDVMQMQMPASGGGGPAPRFRPPRRTKRTGAVRRWRERPAERGPVQVPSLLRP
jgi:hypothetical protein